VGQGTALFVAGTCVPRRGRIDSLELVIDNEPQPLLAKRMPRLDFFASLHPGRDPFEVDSGSSEDPVLQAYRSGFWGFAKLGPGAQAHELRLWARMDDGSTAEAELARVAAAKLEQGPAPRCSWPEGAGSRSVAICMATYNPPRELFRAQIESIRSQTHRNWICLISDDRSHQEAFAAIAQEVEGDERFVVSRSPRRQGFFNNFERALAMAPAEAQFVAMADQDDRWHPDKLTTLLEQIGSAQLIYSDARIVTQRGELVSDTYWSDRRNNHSSLLSLLFANAVTGAASLFRREVLDHALPFPPAQFAHFHDHWIALTALALGDITFVSRPLYDYVQHRAASLGHAAATRMTGLADRLRNQRPLRERVRMWRLHYFVDVCRLLQVATILELRCGEQMTSHKRRDLERFLATDRSLLALGALVRRGARELLGTPETLGAEWMLAHGFAWRRLLDLTARERPRRQLRIDAVPPPSLALKPHRVEVALPAAEVADKVAPLDFALAEDAPPRVNLLIPTIDLEHFFGGYIAKLNLAKRLAAAGLRVRLITTDPVPALPPHWKRAIEAYGGLEGLFEAVEVQFGRGPSPVEVSPRDAFIATTWWTAHIAAAAASRFVYLIQEYEPFTFPMGTYAALAAQSYTYEHFALFSSELLRGYFRAHAIGVYAMGRDAGDASSMAFENAITPVTPDTAAELAARRPRRLLFYARPEQHAARNMFELGILGLGKALDDGLFAGWQLHGIGTVEAARTIPLPGGTALELLPRADQRSYETLLREHDVGLALMYTPHPSLLPIEMAAAAMIAVTNTFENKTADALAAISPNILAGEPSVEGIATCLREAAARAHDYEGRLNGSDVRWSRHWAESFDQTRLERVIAELGMFAPAGG
jgi:glycosyltransferase involved in cell wall biosynthesis